MFISAIQKQEAEQLFSQGQRRCSVCSTIKTLSEFYPRKGRAGAAGLTPHCKSCKQSDHAAYRASPSGRASQRNSNYQKHYGISLEQYNERFAAQGGCCAICRVHQSEIRRALAVDHDHGTEKIRGLLCARCNLGIANLNEDVATLLAAAQYLKGAA